MPDPTLQPYAELATFGEELKREREIRGISLKEISDATKISKRFLEAIERNDHKTLPAPVFTRGFVREYARYLGLNSEDVVNRYNFAAAGDDRIEKSIHLERLTTLPPPREPTKKGIPPFYARIDRNVYITVLIASALIAISWWTIRSKRAERAEAGTETIAAATQPLARPPAEPVPAAAPPPKDDALHLTIEVQQDSFVNLEADGQRLFNDVMKAGERRTYDAKEEFRFRTIGNAGGVVLYLNDNRLPPLGEEGEVVRNRTYNRETLMRLNEPAGGSD
jgi:transcriptional regulator with XRE-family HTH domain